jgi:hypothetical protein
VRVVAAAREAVLAGAVPATGPRPLIGASWQRTQRYGVDPDHAIGDAPLAVDEVEQRRRDCGLADVLPVLRGGLVTVADQASHIMVVVDVAGRVLWRDGSSAVRRRADGLGFVEGASWEERAVGTNAIGTALAVRRPVQVYSAEHYVRTHHAWTCAAAPVHDPRTGRLLGVVDVSGPAPGVHPSTLALVDAVAKLAEADLRGAHRLDLERLRAVATPLLARAGGRAMVTDPHGWIAAVAGVAPVNRVLLPERLTAGRTWLPAHGPCTVEPLPGGWLLRLIDDEPAPVTRVVLDVSRPQQGTLTVCGGSGTWEHALTRRHAEILFVLASHPAGRSAAQLSNDLFGRPSRTVTVRAEMSRLRRHLGGVLAHQPYRFADGVELTVRWPDNPAELLPYSDAPAVLRLRAEAR